MTGRTARWRRLRQVALVAIARGMGTAAGTAAVTALVWWLQKR